MSYLHFRPTYPHVELNPSDSLLLGWLAREDAGFPLSPPACVGARRGRVAIRTIRLCPGRTPTTVASPAEEAAACCVCVFFVFFGGFRVACTHVEPSICCCVGLSVYLVWVLSRLESAHLLSGVVCWYVRPPQSTESMNNTCG